MRDPAFWWRPAGMAAGLLSPLGAVYGAVAGFRLAQDGREVGVPVICIGNLTLGDFLAEDPLGLRGVIVRHLQRIDPAITALCRIRRASRFASFDPRGFPS